MIAQISTPTVIENPGGLERYVLAINEARRMRKSDPIIQLMHSSTTLHWSLRSFIIFLKTLKNFRKIDFIESHYILLGLVTVIFSSKPSVIFFHSPWAEEQRSHGKTSKIGFLVREKIEKAYLSRARIIATVGRSMRDYLVEHYKIPKNRIVVVGAGVNEHLFKPVDTLTKKFTVFSVRRLEPRMGLDDLVTAWHLMPANLRGELRIAGIGSQYEYLKNLISIYSLHDTVTLLGRISETELVAEYQASTISVVPTKILEGFGLVCIESLSCGTPVVSSREGELQYLVHEKWPYLTYDSGRPDQLAEILINIANKKFRLPEKTECIQYAQNFTWENTSKLINRIYENLK